MMMKKKIKLEEEKQEPGEEEFSKIAILHVAHMVKMIQDTIGLEKL